jgi:hypothetical protein
MVCSHDIYNRRGNSLHDWRAYLASDSYDPDRSDRALAQVQLFSLNQPFSRHQAHRDRLRNSAAVAEASHSSIILLLFIIRISHNRRVRKSCISTLRKSFFVLCSSSAWSNTDASIRHTRRYTSLSREGSDAELVMASFCIGFV